MAPLATLDSPRPFPKTRSFTGLNRPSRIECDVFDLEVEGELPADLNGGFYRCGPDPAFAPREGDDIYVNGDGIVTLLRIADGHVDLRMRYVRTDKFLAERRARRALFGAYRNPFTDDPSVAGVDRTTANTSVLWHAGRLYALKEDGLPHVLDPISLRTLGKWDFNGALRSRTFTAHPKLDPLSGDVVFFGYSAKGDELSSDIALCSAAADGTLSSEAWILPPYQSMIHDWGVTEEHVILPVMPMAADADRLRAGGPRWAWDDSKATYLMVVPRRGGPEDVMIFEGPPCFSFHTMNAFTEGNRVHLDINVGQLPPFPDPTGAMPPPDQTDQFLTRWTCDLSKSGGPFESQRLLADFSSDFTDPDPRYVTRPYRYGFMAGRDRSVEAHPDMLVGVYFNMVARIDHETGDVSKWCIGENGVIQEPLFVPRSPDAPEGDGYLLTVANRWPQERGEMLVFDATALDAGPIATAQIPLFQRPVFHSAWVPGGELPAAGSEF